MTRKPREGVLGLLLSATSRCRAQPQIGIYRECNDALDIPRHVSGLHLKLGRIGEWARKTWHSYGDLGQDLERALITLLLENHSKLGKTASSQLITAKFLARVRFPWTIDRVHSHSPHASSVLGMRTPSVGVDVLRSPGTPVKWHTTTWYFCMGGWVLTNKSKFKEDGRVQAGRMWRGHIYIASAMLSPMDIQRHLCCLCCDFMAIKGNVLMGECPAKTPVDS